MTKHFQQVKVFGERNSGTHYIANLLHHNFSCRQLRGTANLSRETMTAVLDGLPPKSRPAERERLTDQAILAQLEEDFGWKHGCVHFEALTRRPHHSLATLFVVVHKHPADWLRSLYRRPYNALQPVKKWSFSEFIRQPWRPSRKENLPREPAANPIELWNEKHRSWLALSSKGYTALYFKNSDFLNSFESTLSPLTGFLKRRHPDSPLINATKATKGSCETVEQLKEKYVETPPFEGYSIDDRQFVEEQLDCGVLSALGYGMDSR
jgi:hypothetical protein